MQNNIIDITPRIRIANNISIHKKQINQLEAIGESLMNQPLAFFENSAFSNKELRSSYRDSALEFRNGIDQDFSGIDNIIKHAKEELLAAMRFAVTLIK